MVVKMSVTVLWVVMPCSLVGGYQNFGEIVTSIFSCFSLFQNSL
jgi:hypothetical protein